jgi:DNA topoisomerase-1
MKLLIVESPSKAKTINNYLGKDFDVISSFGHIRGIPSEEGAVLTEQNFEIKYTINERSQKQIKEILKHAKKCNEIYLATDPDREGEAISWHINEVLQSENINKPFKRVVFHEITKNAVIEAINNPRDIDLNLVHAQQTRQALDYLVGFTISPVLWRKLPGSKSAGRVQSVALRTICEREAEIERFISQEYWSLHGNFFTNAKTHFSTFLVKLRGEKVDKLFIQNQGQAEEIKAYLLKQKYHVDKVEKKQAKRQPAPPFTTSTMLQEAARKLGFTAKKTSMLAQNLYEGMEIAGNTTGLITYMRTDSVSISEEALSATRNLIASQFGNKYLPAKSRLYKTKTKNAQEAHEAIRPTNVSLTPDKVRPFLSADHFALYELIWKRLVASQMENAILDLMSIEVTDASKSSTFRATGSMVAFDGYYKVYKEDNDNEDEDDSDKQTLPPLTIGEDVSLKDIIANQHFTQPAPRYTEASLVKKMEELGIGRPSTYPGIISILQEREYVKVEKKKFIPEIKGRLVNAFLSCFFTQYVQYEFTANMENELDEISNGNLQWKQMLKDFWVPFKATTDVVMRISNLDILQQVEATLKDYIFKASEERKCPSCSNGTLGLKTGKFGAFIGCSNYPECKYTKQLGVQEEGDATLEEAQEATKLELPKVLGAVDGLEISIRKGPYGVYVQKGDGKNVKRTSIPKGLNVADVTLSYAEALLSLPRVLGKNPETNVDIKAGIGRFGPFIEHNGKFKSLKTDDPVTISLERAVALLNEPVFTKPKKVAAPKTAKKKSSKSKQKEK